ncbi:MAG: hypothetical protein SFX73_31145 [Kofleriaceae bacterium]|nr:hypothetical protein [Kofleriaceae bacterium]
MTRADLASCTNPDEGPTAGALLRCKLTDAGSAKLAETTRNNLGKVFEFVIDGKVRMRPRFEAAITGGVLTIWLGDDTAAASEARRLANTLAR